MKIGFIQPEENDSSEAVLGYAETAADEDDEGSWLRIIIDFFIVYGFMAFVRDLIDYLRAW